MLRHPRGVAALMRRPGRASRSLSSIRSGFQIATPLLLAEAAVAAAQRRTELHRDQAWLLVVGDLEQQFSARCRLEFDALADRDHEGASATDHTLAVVEVEIGNVEEARWLL